LQIINDRVKTALYWWAVFGLCLFYLISPANTIHAGKLQAEKQSFLCCEDVEYCPSERRLHSDILNNELPAKHYPVFIIYRSIPGIWWQIIIVFPS
jgi:hypothetical protein